MDYTFDFVSDEMNGRDKLIHSVGSVAKMHWEMNSNNYTGMFQGVDNGLIRISLAAKPDYTQRDSVKGNFIPGMAMKLLRDNHRSANFVAMHSLSPQDSWNPFKYPWSNTVALVGNIGLTQKLLKAKFETASKWALHVGLSEVASYDQSGNEESSPQFPWSLVFKPNPQLNSLPDTFSAKLDDILATIPQGTDIFEIHAVDCPSCKAYRIGTIKTDSQFTRSSYGDQHLFFEHQRKEDDLAIRQDWLDECPTVDSCKVCPLQRPCW